MIETINEITNQFSKEELVKLTSDLIRIPSYFGMKNAEKAVVTYMQEILEKENIEVEVVDVLPGRPNLYAYIRGNDNGKKLMLTGHTDTVRTNEMQIDPFGGYVKNGKLYGRGACDMKGSLGAMIGALIAIKRSNYALKGDLIFAAVIDEELEGKGSEYLAMNGPRADVAIVGEPTKLEIATGHRGLEWLEIKVIGKSTHGGTPHEGINAISKAVKLMTKIEKDYLPKLIKRKHHHIGEPLLNFGTIKGGDQPSTVAGECTLQLDRRWIPNETLTQVFTDIEEIIDELKKEDPEFNAMVKRVIDGDMIDHYPLEIDRNHEVVKLLEGSIKEICHIQPKLTIFPAWTDGATLSHFGKIDSVVFGPGDLSNAHSDVEYIECEELYNGFKIYLTTALQYCNGRKQ